MSQVRPDVFAVPRSTSPEKVCERRKRSAQDKIGFCIAGATATARRVDLEPTEKRVGHPL